MDGWPPIIVDRFDGESPTAYRRRSARIVQIVNGFRTGCYDDRDLAERKEQELLRLQNRDVVTADD